MRFRRQTRLVLVGLLALVAAGCDWPMYGFGPSHQGYQPGENKIGVANIASLTRAWTYPTGFTPSPVAVSRGVAYVDSGTKLFAFEANGSGCSGTPKTCAPLWTGALATNATGFVSLANGVLYVANAGVAQAWAFDAAASTNCSGTPKTCSPIATFSSDTFTAPVVANGVAYLDNGSGIDALTVP